jgi:murein DD-endopeptidase MepM/ murein hydrolase activator NlpD
VDLSPEDIARYEQERAHLAEVLQTFPKHNRHRCASVALPRNPLELVWTAALFNGQPRNPHNGMDIAAPAGTPVWLRARVSDRRR